MLHDVDDGGGIGAGTGLPNEFVVIGQGIGDFYREIARVAFFAIGGKVMKIDTVPGLGAGPKDFIEASIAAMEMAGNVCWRVVGGEIEGSSVE